MFPLDSAYPVLFAINRQKLAVFWQKLMYRIVL